MNTFRTAIVTAAVAIAIGVAGVGMPATANAGVKHCGWGMVLDTQGGVSACKPAPIVPGDHHHHNRHHHRQGA